MRTLTRLFLMIFATFAFTTITASAEEKIIKSHGISTFGELKYRPDFKHFDYVNPNAPKGGAFSTWAFGTFDSLSPYILKGQAAALSTIFNESLMSKSADEPDSYYGLLANSIEYPADKQWVQFIINPAAKFSDNSPVTAEDVVFSYQVLFEKGDPQFKVLLADIEKAEVIEPLKVKFTFKKGIQTRELPSLVAGLPIFSKIYYENRKFDESTLEPTLGSGEYILDSVNPGKTVTYKRRDDYWGKHLPINVGRSNFEKITVEYYTDYTAAFEGFKGGAYNFREEFLSKLWATSYNFPALDKKWVVQETLKDGNPSGTQGYWINMRKEKFKDPRVREAIGLMFNFEWSNKTLFYDQYARTDSFWENSNLQASGLPNTAELKLLEPLKEHLPDTVFTLPAYTPNISKATQLDRSALRNAGKLLDMAGWKVVNGQRQNENGDVLSIKFLNDSPSFERITNPYIANLKRLGIDASLDTVDAAQATERQKNLDFDIVVQRYVMSLTPGIELRGLFSSETANQQGTRNLAGVNNPAIDALIETVEGAATRTDLETAVKALDRSLRALHIWVPQWYKGTHNVAYFDVFDHPKNLPPYSMGEIDFWWYDDEKAKKLQAEGAF